MYQAPGGKCPLFEGDKIASQTLVAPFASAKGGKIRSNSSFLSLMAETSTHSNLKRPHSDDEETRQPSLEKRPRFPKGKKAKKGVEIVRNEESPSDLANSLLAAKERAHRRNRITAELFSEQSSGIFQDVTAAEVNYEAGGNFEDDGILIEPFNLKQEREEGYFDADGNFVECVSEKETKDAWLDSIDVGTQFAHRNVEPTNKEEELQELSSEDIGKMKRRIADLLQPGETVLQALRRLRKSASGKKEKMPEHTKRIFDQLTEDSMKLMENGDYNVYHDEQEVFEREAEGYERVARAREVTTRGIGSTVGEDIFSSGVKRGECPPLSQLPSGVSNLNASVAPVSSDNDVDAFDMFGEDDENRLPNQPNNGDGLSGQNIGSESAGAGAGAGGELETGYVYDESSGYYYSSSLGYYYDPTSGLYCSAATGKWYSYNEQTGAYDEIVEEAASLTEDNAH